MANVPRLDKKSTSGIHITPISLFHTLSETQRLTPRDHHIITLLADHHVLTAEQLVGVGFPNSTRARHRLLLLHQRGVLARFRRYVWPGTQP